MFDAIRNNKRIAQIILIILIIPFAAFGIEHYFGNSAGGGAVATVGGMDISRAEFDRALNGWQDRLRRAGNVSTAELESEAVRQLAINDLVRQRMLLLYAQDMRLIQQGTLAAALRTPANYERLHEYVKQLMPGIGDASPVATVSARRLLTAQLEERVVREMRFPVAPHLAKIKISEENIKKFYDDNPTRFELPERVKAEYVVFSEAALLGKIEVSENDIQEEYKSRGKEYVLPEKRRVRHILIEIASPATEEAVAAARKEADEITALLRKDPDRFPEIAREKSRDITSENGGDLDYITRDTMTPAFDEAAFALKEKEISDPVRTEYGFHIIQVTGIRPGGEKRPLAEVRDEIIAELRKRGAEQKFNDNADKFINMVFNQADSLQPAAEAFGLEIHRTDWINRGTESIDTLQSKDLVDGLFTDDAINKHHNTPAIDIGANTQVSARVIAHETARRLPLEEVRGRIEAQLLREEAARLAREEGNAALAALDKGESTGNTWSAPHSFQRIKGELPPAAMNAVFSAPITQLPVRVAAELRDDAYVIYQIDAVEHPSVDDGDARIAELARRYSSLLALNDLEVLYSILQARYKPEIRLPPRTETGAE
jgi:peptidyl-prolyl cis-trans isomerase D